MTPFGGPPRPASALTPSIQIGEPKHSRATSPELLIDVTSITHDSQDL
jgi:hypothetical protein